MKWDSRHFLLQEFVPKAIYEKFGEQSAWFIDPRLVRYMDFVREYFGKPVTINNWHTGGELQQRGFRDDDYYYHDGILIPGKAGYLSQHRFGRACDYNVTGKSPEQVFMEISSNQRYFIQAGLTTMEDVSYTPTWTHNDIRVTGTTAPGLLIVKP